MTNYRHIKMIERIDKEIEDAEVYSAHDLAEKIVKELQRDNPDLLYSWLLDRATDVVRRTILDREASARARRFTTAKRERFLKAARNFEMGEPDELKTLLDTRFQAPGGLRKKLSQMTNSDLRYVFDAYTVLGLNVRFKAKFFSALSKGVSGNQTVGDVFTNEQLSDIWDSITES